MCDVGIEALGPAPLDTLYFTFFTLLYSPSGMQLVYLLAVSDDVTNVVNVNN
jgi:hypothetical protein